MRFDNRRFAAAIVAATLLGLGACRPSAPGSASGDSPQSATRTDTLPGPTPSTQSARADSVVLRTDKSTYRAGEKITLTFENKGVLSYSFNPFTRTLDLEQSGGWTALPVDGRMCTMEAWILEPHGT